MLSKRNHPSDLTPWQKECLNIAGPCLWFLLLLLFLFTAENGFLPLFYNADLAPIGTAYSLWFACSSASAVLITPGFEFLLTLLAGV